MTEDWRPVVNAVLYMTQFAQALDRAEANRVSTALLERPFGNLTPEQEYRALVDALNSDQELDTVVRVKHSPAEIRNFLSNVVAELDAMRPWRAPPLQEIPATRWPEFANAKPVARVAVAWPAIEGRIDKTFKRLGDSQGVLVKTRSGSELALVWPSHTGKSETDIIPLGSSQKVSALVQELVDATLLNMDEIVIL
ncbi:hypothetical protein [Nocardia amikacinitolerans]|uniref:hypothetical protein n=1 Tax=Nocardia amikacinitolerans TaxID=756689 RepID=UPI0020A46C23|nr:hypothetical protein [Nocardia amikacinitolerans]